MNRAGLAMDVSASTLFPKDAPIRECLDCQRRLAQDEELAVEKVQRLRQRMSASPELKLVLDSGPFGVAVFALK